MMKTRIRFTKTGSMRFVGHLDLMRFFQKALRRAEFDVAYSQGYSPHQIMSFASPLGIGQTTDGDYLDVEFASLMEMSKEEILQKMNKAMTDEIIATDLVIMPDKSKTSMALLCRADYVICWKEEENVPNDLKKKFSEYMDQQEIVITKKTKKSEITEDVKPLIYQYSFAMDEFAKKTGHSYTEMHRVYEDSENELYLQLAAGSSLTINPGVIVDDFLKFAGILQEPFSYQIHRMEMYFNE